jgi:hypothetical protein
MHTFWTILVFFYWRGAAKAQDRFGFNPTNESCAPTTYGPADWMQVECDDPLTCVRVPCLKESMLVFPSALGMAWRLFSLTHS